jgi:hypothetical protein
LGRRWGQRSSLVDFGHGKRGRAEGLKRGVEGGGEKLTLGVQEVEALGLHVDIDHFDLDGACV